MDRYFPQELVEIKQELKETEYYTYVYVFVAVLSDPLNFCKLNRL